MNKNVVMLNGISKAYQKDKKEIKVLDNVNVSFETGKMYAIMGSSGTGKSTLFNIIGLIDSFDTGKYILLDKEINNCNDNELSLLRMENIGFIYQEYNLDPYLK